MSKCLSKYTIRGHLACSVYLIINVWYSDHSLETQSRDKYKALLGITYNLSTYIKGLILPNIDT